MSWRFINVPFCQHNASTCGFSIKKAIIEDSGHPCYGVGFWKHCDIVTAQRSSVLDDVFSTNVVTHVEQFRLQRKQHRHNQQRRDQHHHQQWRPYPHEIGKTVIARSQHQRVDR